MKKYNYVDRNGSRYNVGRWQEIKYNLSGNPYFVHFGMRYKIADFFRLNYGGGSYPELQTASGKTATIHASNGYIAIEVDNSGDNVRIITAEGWWSY